MAIILGIWGVFAFFFGLVSLMRGLLFVKEIPAIEAGIAFLIATVAIGLGGVIKAIQDLRRDSQERIPDEHSAADHADAVTRALVRQYKESGKN